MIRGPRTTNSVQFKTKKSIQEVKLGFYNSYIFLVRLLKDAHISTSVVPTTVRTNLQVNKQQQILPQHLVFAESTNVEIEINRNQKHKDRKKKTKTQGICLHEVQVWNPVAFITKTANCETPNDTSTNFLYNSIRQKQHCRARLWFISSVQTKQLDK